MEDKTKFKIENEEASLEVEIVSPVDDENYSTVEKEIQDSLLELDLLLEETEDLLSEKSSQIDKYTSKADKLDIILAMCSGILSGIIDSVFVGEFSLENANNWGNDKVEKFVLNIAKSKGYKKDDLSGAIAHLENNYGLASDSVTAKFGGGKQHHLRDFTHHPTPFGLMCSIITQFTENAYGTKTDGSFIKVPIKEKQFIGKSIGEKVSLGFVTWCFHIVSDMAGSSDSVAVNSKGTGLPGPLVSLLKEISATPFFKNKNGEKREFSVWVSKLFNGTLFKQTDVNGKIIPQKVDLRTEIGVGHLIGQQTIPVLVNEYIVKGFYFLRHLWQEIKTKKIKSIKDLKQIDVEKIKPSHNRTIARMITVSSATFMAYDLIDASVRTVISGKVATIPTFIKGVALRINYVGLGKLTLAVGKDLLMEVKKATKEDERFMVQIQQMELIEAKVFYSQAGVWVSAQNLSSTLNELYRETKNYYIEYSNRMAETSNSLKNIADSISKVKENNPKLIKDLKDILD